MRARGRLLIFLVCALIIGGCAGQYQHKLTFDPLQPIRVAVLPFAQVDAAGNYLHDDGSLLVDKVALLSAELRKKPEELVQERVQNVLAESALDLVPPVVVSGQLSHHGFANHGGFDAARIFSPAAFPALRELLSCDAVLIGKVTRWERSYYGIQASTNVGLDLRLVSLSSGKELFSASARDSDSRGLTKGPTGFSSLVIEPLKGLDSQITVDLANKMVDTMLAPIVSPNTAPTKVTSPAPFILAAALDQPDGKLRHGQSLTVVMLGSPHQTASFSIGSAAEEIPMVERDPGHYIGEFFPLPTDTFHNAQISVALTDTQGRTTTARLGRGVVSLE